MDPQLMALLAAARQTQNSRNMSGVLGNLDNPLLAFLAGVPASGGADAYTPLMDQYAASDNPAIQEIVNQVNSGVDEFALKNWLNRSFAEPGVAQQIAEYGWSPDELESLAMGLQREAQNARKKSKDTWWAKAGLSDPAEQYTEATVPLSQASAEEIADIRLGSSPARRLLSKAKIAESQAKRQSALEKDQLNAFMKNLRQQQMGRGGNWAGLQLGELQRAVEEAGPDISEEALASLVEEFDPAAKGLDKSYSKQYREAVKRSGTPRISGQARSRVSKAAEEAGLMQQQLNAAASAESAARRGRARAFAEAGRTPTRDQLTGMLRFMTGT